MTKSNHTPTPWKHEKEFNITGPDRRGIATTGGFSDNRQDSEKVHSENIANAALIVHRVNNWDKLVEALEDLLDFSRGEQGVELDYEAGRSKARAALALAKEERTNGN